MPRYDIIATENFRPLKKLVKLHIAVAVYTGIRGNSFFIAFDKFSYDRITEGLGKIEHVERHPELIGYTPCILNIVKRTTGAGALDSYILIVIELHRAADTIKPFVLH